jgi:hypothetical protein
MLETILMGRQLAACRDALLHLLRFRFAAYSAIWFSSASDLVW